MGRLSTTTTRIRAYSALIQLETFEDRLDYLKLGGSVGRDTFGFDRWVNQKFYRSKEWRSAREHVILRDNGCDLGFPGREVHVELHIHHMNPVTKEALVNRDDWILDPEFLITTCQRTHNAIHYGADISSPPVVTERTPGDTTPWRR